MSKKLKQIKERFINTMEQVSNLTGIPANDLKRDEYVRVSVDTGIDDRLNKEELNLLGGFKSAKTMYIRDTISLTQPKVLIFDIETAPILGYVWKLWDNNLGLNMIEDDWYVLSWSAKWLGESEDKVMYADQRNAKDIEDDTKILRGIWKLLDKADIVITQNGKKFDVKKLNARFILNGFEPPSSFQHIDTYQIARRKFGFTSNKLEYMTDKLCTKFKKSGHAKFSGFNLWKQCLAGNKEAWAEMEDYNKLDVLSLEELYTKLIPWDTTVNFNSYHDSHENMCSCGSLDYKKSGFHVTNNGRYQRFKCNKCGSEYRDNQNLLTIDKRNSTFRKTR